MSHRTSAWSGRMFFAGSKSGQNVIDTVPSPLSVRLLYHCFALFVTTRLVG
ncbi:hypothetical protein [Caballeronia concitans]|uniref:hypothetical protein n=1 Tax=Caballeronia concitans TaxID=1777133 RepID=UPI001430AFFA|nr:hypothetical protein [Caballeronia concitans]